MIQNNDFTIIFFIEKQFFYKINVYTNDIYFFSDDKNRWKNKNKLKINRKNECKRIDKILKFFEKFNAFTLITFHSYTHLKSFRTLRFQKNSSINNMNTLRRNIFLKEGAVFFENMIIFETIQTFIVCEFQKIVFWKTLIQFEIHKLIILIKKIGSLNELHIVDCLSLKNCSECFCFRTFYYLNQKKNNAKYWIRLTIFCINVLTFKIIFFMTRIILSMRLFIEEVSIIIFSFLIWIFFKILKFSIFLINLFIFDDILLKFRISLNVLKFFENFQIVFFNFE